jgi:hypothetical protein
MNDEKGALPIDSVISVDNAITNTGGNLDGG